MSVDQLGKAIVATGLLSADELKTIWKALPAQERPKTRQAFADLLVERELLTRFQAQELLSQSTMPLVLGDYVLQEKIGAGGMGQVFRAKHRHMDRMVAIKLLPAALTKDEAAVKRFQREVKAAAKLAHPNIVQAFDASVQRGVWYLVMEHISGRDLSALTHEHGPLPVASAVDYILQAARGLAYAHAEGVVHRDIKPANLLLDRKGTVKILDMGLARFDTSADDADHQLTGSGQVMGTVDYMPPEQAQSTHDCDARSDIYSLGCSLYRLLTCDSVYHGETAVKKILSHMSAPIPSLCDNRPDVPAEIDRIFQKMIAKAPDQRYQHADELIADLEAWRRADEADGGSSANLGDQDSKLSEFFRSIEHFGNTRHGLPSATVMAPSEVAAPQTAMQPTLSRMTAEVMTSAHAARLAPNLSDQIGTLRRLTSGRGKPPVALFASVIGSVVLVMVLGIWLIVRDKEGNEVARVRVPEGGSVERTTTPPVKGGPAKTPAGTAWPRANAKIPADPHRRAAEAVLAAGGTVTILTAPGEKTVSKLADLPDEPFAVWKITVFNSPVPLSGLIDAMAPIQRSLDALVIDRTDGQVTQLSNQDLEKLSNLNCRVVSLNRTGVTDACANALAGWRGVSELQLSYTGAGDQFCHVLANWPTLSTLNLGQTLVTDDGIKALENCPNLNTLNLGICQGITEKGLASIQRMPQLRHLNLYGTNLGDECIDALAAAGHLRYINLQSTQISDEGARRLQSRLPQTYIVHPAAELPPAEQELVRWALGHKARIRHADYSQAKPDEPVLLPAETIDFAAGSPPASEAESLSHARSLRSLIWPDLVSADEAMTHVSKVASLVSLTMEKSDLSEEGLGRLSSLTSLEQVSLSANPRLDDNALRQFPKLPCLWRLVLDGCPVTGAGLEHLQRAPQLQILSLQSLPLEAESVRHLVPLKQLRYLTLYNSPLVDACVPHLSQCVSLRRLNLRGTEITERGIDQLHQALPHCIIQWDGGLVLPEVLDVAVPDSPSVINRGLGNAPDPAAVHRRAAEAVLAAGGKVFVVTASSDKTVGTAADLPNEPFAVVAIETVESQRTLSGVIDAIAPIQQTLDRLVNRGVTVLSQKDLAKLQNLNCQVVYLMNTALTDAVTNSMVRWERVREMDFYGTNVGDETCRIMGNWPALAQLNLAGTSITDDGLTALENCPLLNYLTLQGCHAITDKGLASLQRMPHLQNLNLKGTSFGDGTVDVLKAARQLRYINLQDTGFSDEGVRRLQTLLPRTCIDHPAVELPPAEQELVRWAVAQQARVLLKDNSYAESDKPVRSAVATIDFSAASPPASEAARLAAARCLRRLVWRNLSGADEAIAHLAKIDSLIGLYLAGADLSGEGLGRLSALKSLGSIDFYGCQRIDDAALSQFPELTALWDLTLSGCPITGAGLEHLERTPRLERLLLNSTPLESAALAQLPRQKHLQNLNLDQTPIDDTAVPHLSQCTALRRLQVRGTKLTKRGIDLLHQALPNCTIQWDGGLVLPEVLARN